MLVVLSGKLLLKKIFTFHILFRHISSYSLIHLFLHKNIRFILFSKLKENCKPHFFRFFYFFMMHFMKWTVLYRGWNSQPITNLTFYCAKFSSYLLVLYYFISNNFQFILFVFIFYNDAEMLPFCSCVVLTLAFCLLIQHNIINTEI